MEYLGWFAYKKLTNFAHPKNNCFNTNSMHNSKKLIQNSNHAMILKLWGEKHDYSMKQQIKNPIINLLISFSYKRSDSLKSISKLIQQF